MLIKIDEVRDKNSFVAFVGEMISSLTSVPHYWENLTLEHYLESVLAWIEDSEYEPKVQTKEEFWAELAKLLYVGKIYE